MAIKSDNLMGRSDLLILLKEPFLLIQRPIMIACWCRDLGVQWLAEPYCGNFL